MHNSSNYFFFAMMGIEYLLLIPFLRKLKHFRKEEWVIFAYLICSLVFGTGSYIQGFILRQNNMLFNNCMTIVQFIIVSTFFYLSLQSRLARQVLGGLVVIGLVIFVMDMLHWEGLRMANSISSSYRNLLFIIFGIVIFLELLRDEKLIEQSIYMNSLPLFWLNAGLFIYFCSSLLHNLTKNIIQAGVMDGTMESYRPIFNIVRSVNFSAGIIEFIFFYIGLTKIKKAR